MSIAQLLARARRSTTDKKLKQEEVHLSTNTCWLVLFPPVKSISRSKRAPHHLLYLFLTNSFILFDWVGRISWPLGCLYLEDAQALCIEIHREYLLLTKFLAKTSALEEGKICGNKWEFQASIFFVIISSDYSPCQASRNCWFYLTWYYREANFSDSDTVHQNM